MDKEQCLKLIQLYGEYRRLWDAQCPDYTNRGLREDAWRNISQEMEIPMAELKKKMDSLLGSYRREKSREKKSRITGSGRGEIYVSNWYAYGAFSFLGDRNHPGNTQDTLGEEMLEEPMCPPGACVLCTGAIVAAQEFRNLVQVSQKLWTKAIDNLSLIPFTTTAPVKSLGAFISKDTLAIKTLKDFNGGDAKTVLNRLTRKRKREVTPGKKPRAPRTGPACICNDCGQQFASPYYLNLHLKNSGQKIACLICGSVLIRGREMMEHLSSIHGEITFLCPQCPNLFNKETDLKKHLKSDHKSGALTCGDCGRTFVRNGAFEAHSQMHAVRTCRTCGVQFTNRGCYRKHRSQCEPDAKPDKQNIPRNRRSNIRDPAKFICDFCNKEYRSRPQLKNHITWIHMDVRAHQCQWCGKRFYTSARLTEHKVVHTRERNFECDICGLKLVSKMAAVYHRRRHTGEKPYKCEDCDECFISASRRSEHAKRRHGKGFRFVCPHCCMSFVRGHELRKHIDKVHSVKQKLGTIGTGEGKVQGSVV